MYFKFTITKLQGAIINSHNRNICTRTENPQKKIENFRKYLEPDIKVENIFE